MYSWQFHNHKLCIGLNIMKTKSSQNLLELKNLHVTFRIRWEVVGAVTLLLEASHLYSDPASDLSSLNRNYMNGLYIN